jgi:hypothetical protein
MLINLNQVLSYHTFPSDVTRFLSKIVENSLFLQHMFQLSQGLRRICFSLFVVSFCCNNFARSLVVNHKHRQQLSPLSLRVKFGSNLMSSKSSNNMVKIIDSHVHVWSDGVMPFAYSGRLLTNNLSLSCRKD